MTEDWRADPTLRRAERVLRMVGELHKLGYQRLRVSPGISPSGMHWRCVVTSRSNTLTSNGARAYRDDDRCCARYTSASGNEYLGWTDARSATARQLADLFIERFPELANVGHGDDWPYAGWYVKVLGHAGNGHFPVAYADWELPEDFLRTTGPREVTLPLPPPGEARRPA